MLDLLEGISEYRSINDGTVKLIREALYLSPTFSTPFQVAWVRRV
jgi:hypothetical protein